ncbi:MAG TPA: ATP-binding protein [Thermoanaerobaculia bacterium]
MIRSLRWRLVFATALLIGTMLGAFWLFSTFTVRRQFEQFLIAQRQIDPRGPAQILRTTPDLGEALRRLHEQYGIRSIVVEGKRVVRVYPRELEEYSIRVLDGGKLELTRRKAERLEKLIARSPVVPVAGANVHLLPPPDRSANAPRAFRLSVNRWLLGGLAAAALLAGAVMLTMFRRIFRPVDALTAGARALAGGRLDTRVEVHGNDEVAELGRAFNTMAEAVERNERARRNMVSDVAHELRTPLTSIRVQLEAVQDGVLEPDAKFIASIAEDAAALSHLVDDLQQLSLADAGQLRLELAEVSVAELVERAASGLEARIARDVDPALTVRADARRIVQVIRNLLVNAVAYARSEIAVTAARRGDFVEIRVSDDGPGVPDEQKERIFDRFYRADASRSRSTGGAGLGLAIARQLVELHGGTIAYERPAFVVVLPA